MYPPKLWFLAPLKAPPFFGSVGLFQDHQMMGSARIEPREGFGIPASIPTDAEVESKVGGDCSATAPENSLGHMRSPTELDHLTPYAPLAVDR